MLTWKIVRTLEASILYIYIDKSSKSLGLCLTMKRVKLKYNNIFLNKLVSRDLIKYIYIYIYIMSNV